MAQNEKRFETISRKAEARFSHKKVLDGGGEFADVTIRLEPLPRGAGIEFVNEVPTDDLPRHFLEGVEAGIREAGPKLLPG